MASPDKKYHLVLAASIAFLLSGIITEHFFIETRQNHDDFIRDITQNLDREIGKVDKSLSHVGEILTGNPDADFSDFDHDSPYPFFVFRNAQLVYWSDYRFFFPYGYLLGNYTFKFMETEIGQFLVKKMLLKINQGYHEVFYLIPLNVQFDFENDYVKSYRNPHLFSNPDVRVYFGKSQDNCAIYYRDAGQLFSVEVGTDYYLAKETLVGLVVLLVWIGIMGMVAYLFLWVYHLTKLDLNRFALILLILGLGLVRAVMINWDIPFSIRPYGIFDPRLFASSSLNPSLGDLFLNLLCLGLAVCYLFRYFSSSKLYEDLSQLPPAWKALVSVFLATASFGALYFNFYVLQTIYENSRITMDVGSPGGVLYVKVYSFLIFAILSTVYFLFAHLVFRTFLKLCDYHRFYIISRFLLATFLFLITSIILQIPTLILAGINLTYFAVLYIFGLPRHLSTIKYQTFLYFFVGAMVNSILGAHSIYYLEKNRQISDKQRFANQLLLEGDNLAEFLLFEASGKIERDPYIRNSLFSPFASKEDVEEKILRIFLNRYFDKFDIDVLLFDARGQSLRDRNVPNFHSWKELFDNPRNETNYQNLVFINTADARFLQRYLSFIEIKRRDRNVGYILIDLKLRRFTPRSVYPELLIDRRYLSAFQNKNYNYALYSGNDLNTSSGEFNYSRDLNLRTLNDPVLYQKGLNQADFHHLGLVAEGDERLVISSAKYPVARIISNFSFLFLELIFWILIWILVYVSGSSIQKFKVNYATRIQLYLNLAFIVPLFMVSLATLSFIQNANRKSVINEYKSKSESIRRGLAGKLTAYQSSQITRDNLSLVVTEIANFTETDINLFNAEGQLIASSQPGIYENKLLSPFVNPVAYINLKEKDGDWLILDESVGSLKYKSSYVAIRSFDSDDLIGVISIPFFESGLELDSQLVSVLTNIINIFIFIFILFLIVSFFASRTLTFPLNFITQRIKKTNLSALDEPVNWESDDEIGMLVGEYNRMLVKLEASKDALAQTEKESAWREMAKQVAHEIKNPLTPMKLSLQHLKRMLATYEQKPENIEKPVNNLLHQIQTLSDIATSFSSFAQMPSPKTEKLELASVLRKTVSLYDNGEGKMISNIPEGEFPVLGDEQLLSRIITNLIINGFQAVPKYRDPKVGVRLVTKDGNRVLIEVKDNGDGIPDSIQRKVFMPNFSTKTNGSGIGLAIAKRGIEHAGGRIWFETKKGVGTSFFISLPLVE